MSEATPVTETALSDLLRAAEKVATELGYDAWLVEVDGDYQLTALRDDDPDESLEK